MLTIEIIAALFGLTCVYLQTKENIWAWPAGIISVALYAYIFGESYLFSDMILNGIFVLLNFYGWWNWSQKGTDDKPLEIKQLNGFEIGVWSMLVLVSTFAWGYVMDTNTAASFAYADAFTTVASLVAQYLLTRKVIENWIIWIVVDIVAITLYLLKGLNVTAVLYAFYLVLCILGWIKWRSLLQSRHSPNS